MASSLVELNALLDSFVPKTKILAGARKQKQKTFSQVKIPVEILLYPREK